MDRAVAQATEVSAAAEQAQAGQRSVELASADMKATVTLARLRAGPGYAIVIASVAPGSEAASAGVRPGQQLLQVSDPIRPNEVWQLNESSSLRHVRQAVRMRVPDTITLLLSREPIPEWAQHVVAARAAAAAEREQTQDPGRQQQQQQGEAAAAGDSSAEAADDLLSAIVQAASSGESMDSGDEGGASAGGRGGLTVAEKLEAQYRQQQEAEGGAPEAAQAWQALTALEKRQKRRKEYFEQASERNDGPFFAGVAALFVLPPAIILLAASASGYLDSLDMYGAMR
ncbi:hypothetical protein CHLNCDRAFT_137078 [Chlorella variabilis]|uniref:PDZ domain-containing protein n=1 Tax=Chlorella variabilis TaxID=554065 RepID=E1ZLY4_CHLVA|nr:hypothetical protein CHLNCDRAFT_137078 [Chlorella variabilis]EFN53348.1 hypothetical protein CHLNCDRAFT_137078 [Chlorella variabilis]|eukprot:XP_005845450.1 hypothetical protein CHLNCDRAFT_137078 [Chlorella variabilis]